MYLYDCGFIQNTQHSSDVQDNNDFFSNKENAKQKKKENVRD